MKGTGKRRQFKWQLEMDHIEEDLMVAMNIDFHTKTSTEEFARNPIQVKIWTSALIRQMIL